MGYQLNNLKRNLRYGSPWMIIVILILIFSFLFMFISNLRNRQLDVYTESNTVDSFEYTEEKEDITSSMYEYKNTEYGYTLKIPKEWTKIEEDGVVSFIHKPSASSITILNDSYHPTVNCLTETDMSNLISSEGHNFISFRYLTTSCYELVYQDQQANIYDYMEEVFWNQESQVTLQCCFANDNYEKIIPYYQAILESFTWTDEEKMFNDNVAIYYSDALHMQFGIPNLWERAEEDTVLTAYDADTGTNFTFTFAPMNHQQLNGTDVSNALNEGLSNFVMNSYDGDTESGHAMCSYMQDNVQYTRNAYVYAKDGILYFMIYDYQTGMLDEALPELCQSYVKFFPVEKTDESSSGENSSEESSSETQETPSSQEGSTAPAEEGSTEASSETTTENPTNPSTENVTYPEQPELPAEGQQTVPNQ